MRHLGGHGKCVMGATCAADGHTLVPVTGASTDCSPYTCVAGACVTMCTSVSDCVSPAVCNATGQCVAPPSSGSGNSGGGCAVAPGPSRGSLWPLAALALLATLSLSRFRSAKSFARSRSALSQNCRPPDVVNHAPLA